MNNLIAPLVVIIAYLLCTRLISTAVRRYGASRSVGHYRIKHINRTLAICITVIFSVLFLFSLGIEYHQVHIFLTSMVAILGVVLFAQWSILSNITASLIIFFAFPYRVGDEVKVVDKDDDISGIIEEISLFHVIIRKNDELITYPNNLILQKAVIKKSKSKHTPAKIEE